MIFKISSEKIEEFIEKQHSIDGMVSMHDFELWLEEQPRVGEWIPCSERLPEEPKENPLFEGAKVELYLVSCGEEFYPFRAFWNGKNFTDGLCKVNVEAYMPLPPAYKEGE